MKIHLCGGSPSLIYIYTYIVLGGVPNNPQPSLEPKESLGRNMAKIGEDL
jgi:hypothetical protein